MSDSGRAYKVGPGIYVCCFTKFVSRETNWGGKVHNTKSRLEMFHVKHYIVFWL